MRQLFARIDPFISGRSEIVKHPAPMRLFLVGMVKQILFRFQMLSAAMGCRSRHCVWRSAGLVKDGPQDRVVMAHFRAPGLSEMEQPCVWEFSDLPFDNFIKLGSGCIGLWFIE